MNVATAMGRNLAEEWAKWGGDVAVLLGPEDIPACDIADLKSYYKEDFNDRVVQAYLDAFNGEPS